MPWAFASAGQKRLLRPVAIDFADGELVGRPRAEDAEILGQHDEARALRSGLSDQRFRLGEVRGDVATGHRLHGGNAHRRGGARHRVMPAVGWPGAPGARLAVAAVLRVTIGSDQLPVTVYS